MNQNDVERTISRAIYTGGMAIFRKLALFAVVVLVFDLTFDLAAGRYNRDSTDGTSRSGMRPHTDNATGCQYLSVKGGGITPRIDAYGKHYGCRQNPKAGNGNW